MVASAAWSRVGGLEHQLHWETLRRGQPSAAALARLRQAGRGIHIPLADTPADALHPSRQHTPGQYIEHHLGSRAGLDVLQVVLAQEGLQPYQLRVEEAQRRLTGGSELSNIELQVGYDPVPRRQQRGAGQVEAGLLERRQCLADLRVVGALGAEFLARLLQ